jgi:ABC-2 type transport system permease protein
MKNPVFLTIYWRDMLRFVRFRALLFSSLLQPALWMAFFGLAMSSNFDRLGSVIAAPPGVETITYLTFMAAGIIAMTTLFTSLFGGISLLFDKNWGLMREMLASPMPRTHLVLGIGLSGMTKSMIQAAIILVFGLFLGVGFFPDTSAAGILVSIFGITIFLAVFSAGFTFLSSGIALQMESHEGLQGVITLLSMPLFFTSNALYPIDAFPPVLKALSLVNPLTYLINGIRYFAIGDDFFALGVHYHYTAGEILFSFGVLAVFTSIMLIFARYSVKRVKVTG